MQFREIRDTDKIQCLVARYDVESKRTRQRLLCTIDMSKTGLSGEYMSSFFALGSADERATYVQEIDAFLAEYRLKNASTLACSAYLDLGSRSYDLAHLLKKTPNSLSGKDRENLASTLEYLISELRKP